MPPFLLGIQLILFGFFFGKQEEIMIRRRVAGSLIICTLWLRLLYSSSHYAGSYVFFHSSVSLTSNELDISLQRKVFRF